METRRPVSRVLCRPPERARRSFLWTAHCWTVLATYPDPWACDSPAGSLRREVPIRSCSWRGLPCRPCCQGRGALLPHRFTLAVHARRFDFCGAIPGVAPAGRYPAPCFRGARTFLQCVSAPAIIQPSGSTPYMAGQEGTSRLSSKAASSPCVSSSATPSSRDGRKCRWKATTTSRVASSNKPVSSIP